MPTMPSMLPPLDWHSLLHTWHARPFWFAAAALVLLAYLAALVACRRHGVRAVHPTRVASFVAGIALLLFTLSSGVDVYAMAVFWDHMVEHLLLIMVVPTLLVLGHPLTVLRAAASIRGRADRVDAVLRSRPVALLTHPLVGLGLYSIVIVGTHLTSFMDAMATHHSLMYVEQVLYLVSGYLFLLPLLGDEPIRWRLPHPVRIALALAAMTPDTVVGIVLLQTTSDLFPTMESAHPAWAPSPVQDLQTAGGLMWAGGDGLMMFFAIGLTIAFISHPGERAVLGSWLENVRRTTMTEHVARDADGATFGEDVDVDEDEAVLAAYNRMLRRLNGPEGTAR